MKAKWNVMKNKPLNEKNVYFTYHGYRFIAEWDSKENVFHNRSCVIIPSSGLIIHNSQLQLGRTGSFLKNYYSILHQCAAISQFYHFIIVIQGRTKDEKLGGLTHQKTGFSPPRTEFDRAKPKTAGKNILKQQVCAERNHFRDFEHNYQFIEIQYNTLMLFA